LSFNRRFQQASAAYKTPANSFTVGDELHGYIVKEVRDKIYSKDLFFRNDSFVGNTST